MSYQPHPLRVQRKRTKGYRLPAGAVVVTRPTKWGNPFTVALMSEVLRAGYWGFLLPRTREQTVIAYRQWLENHPDGMRLRADLRELRGKQLACYCPLDKPCHADVLAELANR